MKAKKFLKFLSNSFAGILFTLSFFLLFKSIFVSGLLENLPVLESSLQKQLSDKDLILEQIAKESNLTQQEVKEICKQNPDQPGCEQIENPGLAAKPVIDEINKQVDPYKLFIENSKFLAALVFILSIFFYFLGTMSIYASLFKISINTLISAIFGYVTFASLPKSIPVMVDQAFNIASADISNGLPVSFKETLVAVINDWLKVPMDNLNTLFIYLIAISLLTSIWFYFLKKRYQQNN